MATPIIGAPSLAFGQALPETTVNEIASWLEAGARCYTVDGVLSTPPGSPANGNRYIVGASATGAWTGEEDNIALLVGGAWVFLAIGEGILAYDRGVDAWRIYEFGAWRRWNGPAPEVTEKTGTSYTATLADLGMVIRFNNAAAITFTIPTNAAVAFPIGTAIEFIQAGAGAVTATPDTGVTLRARGTFAQTAGQWAVAMVRKIAADEWVLTGDLA